MATRGDRVGAGGLVSTVPDAGTHESAARTYARRLPVVLSAGEGVHVRDSSGRVYIDCVAGAGALALGHSHPVVVAALRDAIDAGAPSTTLDLATPWREEFIEALFDVLPEHLRDGRIHFCAPSGADAIEAAFKLARIATGRAGAIAFGGAYHGMTSGSMALSATAGDAARATLRGPDVAHLPFPGSYRCPFGEGGERGADLCARMLRWAVEDPQSGLAPPAAIFIEPIQGEGGVNPAPRSFATAVRAAAQTAGAVLVADEVQTGLGRCGTLWASDELDLEPDVLVLSKAIGGGQPLAVIVYRAELDVWRPGAHAGTFRGSQLAFAAGAATIRHVAERDLAAHARAMGELLLERLAEAAAGREAVAEVRGRGLMLGVELVDPGSCDGDGVPLPDGRRAAAVQRELLGQGVMAEVGGRADSVVRFLPALVIQPEHVAAIGTAFARALAATERR